MKANPAPSTWSRLAIAGALAILFPFPPASAEDQPPPNTLSQEEARGGWQLLFDGRTTRGWRGFRKDSFPAQGWVVEAGCLRKQGKVRGGDIVTERTFGDFELAWDWRLEPRGNNGVKYFVTESRAQAPGHEYQMIDDAMVKDPKGRTAAFYDVLPVAEHRALKPPGDWNRSRLVVRGDRVEHWLNDQLVLAYEPGSPTVQAAVAQSKFKDVSGFGSKIRGHILLTDHNDAAWFRNLKVREFGK